jgi:flagellar assembly protein FliH
VAKNVFRSNEVQLSGERVAVAGPEAPAAAQVEPEFPEVEEYAGPTVEDIRREAEEFKAKWDAEREQMIASAKEEADRIIKEAESKAFDEVRSKNEQAQTTKQEAEEEAKRLVDEAKEEADKLISDAQSQADSIEREAREKGVEQGEEKGFAAGRAEVDRLIDRLHVIINKSIERRHAILEEAEGQIVELVLQIAKKVVKVISENQKNVVINNVVQALRVLKSKSDVTIRVNMQDLQMTSEHTQQIIRTIERVGNVTVAEDSTVDPGGAIIETDFGQIDARISSQLREIEDRILQLSPIRSQTQEE